MNQLIIAVMKLMNSSYGLRQIHVSITTHHQLDNYCCPHLKTAAMPSSQDVVASGSRITDYMDLHELNLTWIV